MKLSAICRAVVFLSAMFFVGELCAQINDAVIVSDIKNKIEQNHVVALSPLLVVSNNGKVKLSGVFLTSSEASKAIALSESAEGVRFVDVSDVVVKKSDQPLEDMFITAKVKGRLVKEKLLGDLDAPVGVQVETKNGVVYLTNKVRNQKDIARAVAIAKSVKGVKVVISNLTSEV